jgi:hypothetical protein
MRQRRGIVDGSSIPTERETMRIIGQSVLTAGLVVVLNGKDARSARPRWRWSMGDVREKLVELIQNEEFMCHDRKCEECKHISTFDCLAHCIADTLIFNGVTIQRWIPVAERLPEEDKLVMMLCKNGAMFVGYCGIPWGNYERRWHIKTALNSTKLLNKGRVSHWMPLPRPPREVK